MRNKISTATFGAGCFWGVQKAFSEMEGVVETTVGYTGGHTENPTYEEVKKGETGHVESVRIRFNPDKVSYGKLLEKFWDLHDAVEEVKRQYRSIIFYHNEEQRAEAVQSRMAREKKIEDDIITDIVPALDFYEAEDYHQHYIDKNEEK